MEHYASYLVIHSFNTCQTLATIDPWVISFTPCSTYTDRRAMWSFSRLLFGSRRFSNNLCGRGVESHCTLLPQKQRIKCSSVKERPGREKSCSAAQIQPGDHCSLVEHYQLYHDYIITPWHAVFHDATPDWRCWDGTAMISRPSWKCTKISCAQRTSGDTSWGALRRKSFISTTNATILTTTNTTPSDRALSVYSPQHRHTEGFGQDI